MNARLDGKIALVSGAARGMGAAIARLFVAEGAKVVLGDILDDAGARTATALGEAASYCHLDVTRESDWRAAVSDATSRFGKLDVLVNNAGIYHTTRLVDYALEDYLRVVQVNQIGVFLGMKTAAPAMIKAGGGSIVNLSSTQGIEGLSNAIAYVASKFAVRGMTKTAALELGPFGIRVNSIHPGAVDTDMLRSALAQNKEAAKRADTPPPSADGVIATAPLRRVGRPEDIARLALFLACDDSAYSTGAEFLADGGMLAGPR